MKPIKHIKVNKDMKAKELVEGFSGCAFGAGKVYDASKVFLEMINDKDCKVYFGLAGAMVPGGMKEIVIDMLEKGFIDVFVSTGANLTHDLVESLGHSHYKGFCMNDKELHEKEINRIYDSFMKNEVYEDLEDFFKEHFDYFNEAKNIREFLWKIGSKVEKRSILKVCYDKKIPIFCPAIADSAIGLMMWGNLAKGKEDNIRVFDDLKEILDISWTAKKTGVFYVGGGVPKNFIQQSMQFSKGASYGVQITTDRVESGGSSGAELQEGISWGKLKEKARFVDLRMDASVALPLIYSYII